MKCLRRFTCVGLCMFAAVAIETNLLAAVKIWNGSADTDLANGTNWTGGLPGASDSAEFSSAIAPDPTIGDITVSDLYFTDTSKAYNIGGGTITIASVNLDTWKSSQPQTFSNSLLSVVIATSNASRGVIAGSNALGTGKLTIASNTFTFSGPGVTGIRAINADLDITSTNFNATGGGTNTLTANANRTITISPAINVGNGLNSAATDNITISATGTGQVLANGGFAGVGTLASTGGNVTKAGTGTLVLGSSGSWAGKVTINDGTLRITSSASLGGGGAGNGYTDLAAATGTLALNAGSSISTDESFRIVGRASGGAAHFSNEAGNNTLSGGLQFLTGTSANVFVQTTADSLTFSGVLDNNSTSNRSLTFNGAGASNISGTNNLLQSSTGRWNIVKNNAGKLTINGGQNFTGSVTINAGQVEIQNSGSLGLGGVVSNAWTAVLFTPGTALVLNSGGSISSNENIFLRGKATVDASIINTAGNNALTGRIETEIQATGNNDVTFQSDGGSLTLSGTIAQVLATPKTLNLIGGSGGSGEISGQLKEEGGLWNVVKAGAATWTISGSQDYAGTTEVDAGKLLINATHTGTGGYSVGASGILGGSGSISAVVSVDGVLAPGASIESLAAGAVALNSTSTYAYDLNTSLLNGDLLVANGTLTIAGGAALSLTDEAPGALTPSIDKLALINYSGSWNGGIFNYLGNPLPDDSIFTLGANTWQINYDDSTGGSNFTGDYVSGSFVTITVVPEPSAFVLVVIGLLGACYRNRRV